MRASFVGFAVVALALQGLACSGGNGGGTGGTGGTGGAGGSNDFGLTPAVQAIVDGCGLGRPCGARNKDECYDGGAGAGGSGTGGFGTGGSGTGAGGSGTGRSGTGGAGTGAGGSGGSVSSCAGYDPGDLCVLQHLAAGDAFAVQYSEVYEGEGSALDIAFLGNGEALLVRSIESPIDFETYYEEPVRCVLEGPEYFQSCLDAPLGSTVEHDCKDFNNWWTDCVVEPGAACPQ